VDVGFIGLGHLGHTIARRLIDHGVSLTVWNRTPAKAVDLGVPIAASPKDLAASVDIVIINLFDSDAVEAILTGPEGLLSGPCAGKVIIDTTTNHFGRVGDFYARAREHGATYLECPVLGSVIPASQGKLTILVSGDKAAYESVWPLLSLMGSTLFYLAEPALATKMKLVNNLVLGSFMATCAEAVALGEAAGIDRSEVIDILLAGAGNSMVLAAKKDKLKNEEFSAHFSSALIYKDLHYLQDLCRTLNKPLFVGSTVKELFAIVRSRGIDDQDFSAIYEVFKGY
jgi:3-hydroxyisobutyrate dehydrogenase